MFVVSTIPFFSILACCCGPDAIEIFYLFNIFNLNVHSGINDFAPKHFFKEA
jgi:hypothetical protein